MGHVPTISVEKTDGCQMYLSKESAENSEIITAKSSEMNVLVPKPDDDGDFVSVTTHIPNISVLSTSHVLVTLCFRWRCPSRNSSRRWSRVKIKASSWRPRAPKASKLLSCFTSLPGIALWKLTLPLYYKKYELFILIFIDNLDKAYCLLYFA